MNEEGFYTFMKKKRKSENTIQNCIAAIKELETYLGKQQLSLDTLSIPNLETFISDYLDKNRTTKFLWSINYYFLFIGRDDLLHISHSIRGKLVKKARKPFKLRDFRGVRAADIDKLEALGIDDNTSMLERGQNSKLRKELATQSGLSIKVIEEIVKLSDLARIPGVKGIRARLYYDSGFDTCKKISLSTQEIILEITQKFVEETGFDGIAPLPKEISYSIEIAKKLPDIVEW
ncbi:DUF4332 domain-containing protein [Candidatus Thorarchaeota archaeon]|nr:MAG: DUF4332 domain-containing protein [Candidatus Thorarchaeota archaeon]